MITAIYGGTFNPPHLGHKKVAQTVMDALLPDRLLIMPDYLPPHKELAAGSPSAENRLRLCRACFSDIPGVLIDERELKRSGTSYTADTLRELRGEYPEDCFYLVIGSDMLLSFTKWYNIRYIFSECTLAVLLRDEQDRSAVLTESERLSKEYGARIRFIDVPPLVISSSEIRSALKEGRGREYLSPGVCEIIENEGFYKAAGPEVGICALM